MSMAGNGTEGGAMKDRISEFRMYAILQLKRSEAVLVMSSTDKKLLLRTYNALVRPNNPDHYEFVELRKAGR
jgi:hypothetical protein